MFTDIPILLLDLEGFSTLQGTPEKRAVLEQLQRMLTQAARFFMPFGDPWKKWRRHGTGDGYYFLFDGNVGPQVALRYYQSIADQLTGYNDGVGKTFPIRIRAVLAHGNVELVDDQLLSDEFIQAERFISDAAFKQFASQRSLPASLAVTNLFHHRLQRSLLDEELFPESQLKNVKWNELVVVDKHGQRHRGQVEGVDWLPAAQIPLAPPAPHSLRLGILLGHSRDNELPEAVEMMQAAVNTLRQSHLDVRIWVDQASEGALRRLGQAGCDILVFYGHGTELGRLLFVEGARDFGELSSGLGLQAFWRQLQGAIVFACYGDRFAENLPCPWVGFTEEILRDAPRGYFHALVDALKQHSWREAISLAHQRTSTR